MSVINTEIKPFTAQAFKNGEFITVSDTDGEREIFSMRVAWQGAEANE